MSQEIYLDNNATTKPLEKVVESMVSAMGDAFGNPSSAHVAGDRGRELLRNARERVAQLLAAESESVVFTSSGTEANNIVLNSAASRIDSRRYRIVTTNTEHSSVLKMVEHQQASGVDIVIVPVGEDGIVELDRLEAEITSDTSLVSVHWANNETGVVQPVEQIAEICRSRDVLFHSDACQALGKLPMQSKEFPDLVTATAHKIHGPQGVGAVYARDRSWLVPMFRGGPQEDETRAGTENVPGIVGFGTAAECRFTRFDADRSRLAELRDQFEQRIQALLPDVTINGHANHRICNTTNLCFRGVDGQALVARLDQFGIRCSQSSACTNHRPEPSYVLRAMGLSEADAYSSIRFSFGIQNTVEEAEEAALAIQHNYGQLRGFASQMHNPYHAART